RVHPGETPSQFVIHGVIDFLVGNSQRARALRNKVMFKIIPMLNPDGVFNGNYRSSYLGFDLNRHWLNPSSWAQPEIFSVKQVVTKMYEDPAVNLDFYIDIHAHSIGTNSFMYGNNVPTRRCLQIEEPGPHGRETALESEWGLKLRPNSRLNDSHSEITEKLDQQQQQQLREEQEVRDVEWPGQGGEGNKSTQGKHKGEDAVHGVEAFPLMLAARASDFSTMLLTLVHTTEQYIVSAQSQRCFEIVSKKLKSNMCSPQHVGKKDRLSSSVQYSKNARTVFLSTSPERTMETKIRRTSNIFLQKRKGASILENIERSSFIPLDLVLVDDRCLPVSPCHHFSNPDRLIPGKEGTGRQVLGHLLSPDVLCYTLEVSFYASRHPKTGLTPYTREGYMELGR
ncbi:unnamed protein product, partial [Choristocarpus tenellus]